MWLCKAKMQYLLTCKVSRYCFLHSSINILLSDLTRLHFLTKIVPLFLKKLIRFTHCLHGEYNSICLHDKYVSFNVWMYIIDCMGVNSLFFIRKMLLNLKKHGIQLNYIHSYSMILTYT